MNKAQRNIQIIFTIALCAYALLGLLQGNGSIFFIVYLFWFDELIRTISLYVQSKIYTKRNPTDQSFKTSFKLIKGRIFMLLVYSVFIVIVFGIFFNIFQKDLDNLTQNVLILTFNNLSFNICLLISIVREILTIRANSKLLKNYKPDVQLMSTNIMTLHISIILGGLFWAFVNGKIGNYKLDLGLFQPYAIGIPFFAIKLFFDIRAAKEDSNNVVEQRKV